MGAYLGIVFVDREKYDFPWESKVVRTIFFCRNEEKLSLGKGKNNGAGEDYGTFPKVEVIYHKSQKTSEKGAGIFSISHRKL